MCEPSIRIQHRTESNPPPTPNPKLPHILPPLLPLLLLQHTLINPPTNPHDVNETPKTLDPLHLPPPPTQPPLDPPPAQSRIQTLPNPPLLAPHAPRTAPLPRPPLPLRRRPRRSLRRPPRGPLRPAQPVSTPRRAATLRSFPGDTALPGGKLEPGDKTLEDTARREAFEEIGLPIDRTKVPLLCVLEPFLVANKLVVTPVVVLILDPTLTPLLSHPEVHSLFSHPLLSFLSPSSPFPLDPSHAEFSFPYYSFDDVPWKVNGKEHGKVRVHRFLTGREAGGVKPVFGVTAAILIHTASLSLHPPTFSPHAPTQLPTPVRIALLLKHDSGWRESQLAEGLDPERVRVPRWERERGRGRRRGRNPEREALARSKL